MITIVTAFFTGLVVFHAIAASAKLPKKIQRCKESYDSCRESDTHICLKRFANAIPDDVFQEFKKAVQEHEKAGDEFGAWAVRDAPPSNIYEKVAGLVAKQLELGHNDWNLVEYWTKSGRPDNNYHFDSHEEWEDCAGFPYMSTILYLDSRGPPTLLFGKTLWDNPLDDPSAGPANDTTYLSWPAKNHLLAFSGDLYHGVHYGEGMDSAHGTPKFNNGLEKDVEKGVRQIALFNFWKHKVVGGASPVRNSPPKREDQHVEGEDQREAAAAAAPIPLLKVAASEGVDFKAHGGECFGGCFTWMLTYRLPAESDFSKLVCTFNKRSWKRKCSAGSKELLLIGATSSLRSVRFLKVEL